jgi:hypothetical protein
MKWFFGIAAVMLMAHLYFKWGERKIRRSPEGRPDAERLEASQK